MIDKNAPIIDPDYLTKLLDLQMSKVVGYNLMALCPFHNDTRPSFGISIVSGAWRCFGCEQRGRKLDTLFSKLGKDVPMVYRTLSGKDAKVVTEAIVDYEIDDDWLEFLSANPKQALKSLHSMKKDLITLDTIKAYSIGFAKKRGVVYFPILRGGSLIAYQERHPDWVERYRVKPPGTRREELLFGFDVAKEHGDAITLVEGATDVLMLYEAGYKSGVATCGSVFFDKQADIIVKNFTKVLIIPDNDKKGTDFTLQVMYKLKNRVRYLYGTRIQGHSDVGDATIGSIRKAMGEIKFLL